MKKIGRVNPLLQLVPRRKFDELCQKWEMDKGVREFSTWEQTCALILTHVLRLESYREIHATLGIARSTFSDANAKRSHGFFEDLCGLILIYLIDVEKVASHDRESIAVKAIAGKLGLPLAEVAHAVDLLTASELGHIRPEERLHLVFNKVAPSVSPRDFVKNVLAETLRRLPAAYGKDDSFFTTHAFSLPEASLEDLRREFKELVEKFMAQAADDPENLKVIQLSCQFFTFG